jgi:hypothetical protein
MGKAWFTFWVASMILLAPTRTVDAYNLFGPYPWGTEGDTYYNKWGDIFHAGTSGGTVTWSLMPDGTTIDPKFMDANVSGTSVLSSIMNDLGSADALAAIERCFDRWSEAANIYFVQVSDDGSPFNGDAAHPPGTGEIRIGAFAISGGVGAVGYAPPPNGGSLEGDLLLNSENTFYFDSSGEGEPIHIYNDFESLLMHELGHALGMDHSDTQAVMSADPAIFQFVNRELDADDIAGIQFLYGAALAADFNRDHAVGGDDLLAWTSSFGSLSGATRQTGDATKDGAVTGADFLVWQRESGSGGAGGLRVPEPTAGRLIAAAAIWARARGARRRSSARSAR